MIHINTQTDSKTSKNGEQTLELLCGHCAGCAYIQNAHICCIRRSGWGYTAQRVSIIHHPASDIRLGTPTVSIMHFVKYFGNFLGQEINWKFVYCACSVFPLLIVLYYIHNVHRFLAKYSTNCWNTYANLNCFYSWLGDICCLNNGAKIIGVLTVEVRCVYRFKAN